MLVLVAAVVAALSFGLGIWVGRRTFPAVELVAEAAPDDAPPDDHALVEHHRDGFIVANARGAVTYRNEFARDLQGTHVGVLVDEAVDRHIAAALREGSSHEVLEMYGPPKVVLVVEAVALAGGGVTVYIEDVSERRRIDQVRTDFVANISHELKTPVGAMSVLAETLESEDDPETVHRVVGRIMGEAQRASRTIDDLIELSRIELGGVQHIELVGVDAVVVEAIDRMNELAAHSGIGITNVGESDQISRVIVQGDRRQLVSAVGNLVENAVKYSEPGGQVQVQTRLTDGRVEIAVIDQGVGIPQRDLDRIFERFYRVDRARSRATGGTGLGLSIVRHVAHNHGGDVDVRSAEGEGSTFTLRLPARLEPRQPGSGVADESHLATNEPDSSSEAASAGPVAGNDTPRRVQTDRGIA